MASSPSPLYPSASGARRSIGTYSSYVEAERAVDSLSDQAFPIERVAIIGTELRTIEQIVRRVTIARAALTGAGEGAGIGLFFTLLFGLFFDGPGFFSLLAYAVITGALVGGVFGAIGHAAQGGRRDFASIAGTYPSRYSC
jgi:hypothetical protein